MLYFLHIIHRSSTSYKLKKRVLVSDLWIGESVAELSEVSTPEPNKSFIIGWPTTNYIATFSTKELRDRWEVKLRRYDLVEIKVAYIVQLLAEQVYPAATLVGNQSAMTIT